MLGTGSIRDLRETATKEIQKLRSFNWLSYFAVVMDGVVRGLTAGFSLQELRAVVRGDPPTERPNPRYKSQVKSFMLHLRPKYYRRASTWFTHTWRLGWFSIYFFVVETITGIILMLFYAPTPERAYGDMLYLMSNVPYGLFMRDLHRLGAEGMVAVVVLHMVRVYFTGSYKGERAFTWFTGVILLLVTLVLSFSGYLLPWDQLAYWAVTIGTSMADSAPLVGTEVNLLLRGAIDIWDGGLLRFYLLHVLLLPLVAIILISIHYYKVCRDHSISLPAWVEEGEMDPEERKHAEERIDLIPDLVIHELMLTSVATFLMVIAVATFYHAPLEAHADQAITPLHTEAPWYFLWLQGLLKLGDPTLMGVAVPTIIFGVLFVVPWLDRNPYRLPSRRPAAIIIGVVTTVVMIVLTYMGTPGYAIETPPAQDILSHLVPATHPGPVKELGWDEVEAGPVLEGEKAMSKRTYFVSYPESYLSDPAYADNERFVFIKAEGVPMIKEEDGIGDGNEFLEILQHFKAEVESQYKLMAPVDESYPLAQVTVEEIHPNLKWVEFTISWDEIFVSPKGENVIENGEILLKREVEGKADPDRQIEYIALDRYSNYH
jgi:ubiquinol-cytochrome c reductase cytochrome b subunit